MSTQPQQKHRQWQWDETLFAGTAAHYSIGRMPYPPELITAVRDELGLDGTGRLPDVGCGPGALTLPLAPLVETVVGVDPDPDMIAEARRRADAAGIGNIEWRTMRAEDLSAGPGLSGFRAAVFAQSFHWMDQPLVAELRGLLREAAPDGRFSERTRQMAIVVRRP